jgi:hypothetical protein
VFKVSLGVLSCPDCGGALHYSGIEEIEIFDACCLNCRKDWRVVKYPDGRREIRKKIAN